MFTSHCFITYSHFSNIVIKLQQNNLDMDSVQIEMKCALEKAGEEHEKRVKLVRTRVRAIVKTLIVEENM